MNEPTEDVFRAWLTRIAPSRAARVHRVLTSLEPGVTYGEPAALPADRGERALLGTEFSVRVRGAALDVGRLAWTAKHAGNRLRDLLAAVRAIGDDVDKEPLVAVGKLIQVLPRLDLLIGLDAPEDGPARAKVYVLRPGGARVYGFDGWGKTCLERLGVPPAAWDGFRAATGDTPAFLAVDLVAGRPPAVKLYASFAVAGPVDRALAALGADGLRTVLAGPAAAAAPQEVARWVVTARYTGETPSDVTLHAWCGPEGDPLALLGPFDGAEPLAAAWADLQHAAASHGRALRTSYVSWVEGPEPAHTLYYQLEAAS